MTKQNAKLDPIAQNNDRRIKRTYKVDEAEITITKAWLTIKSKETDLDVNALIQKDISTTLTSEGHITDNVSTAPANELVMYFQIPKAESALAKVGVKYFYDIQIKQDSGEIYTMEKGTVEFFRRVTEAIT